MVYRGTYSVPKWSIVVDRGETGYVSQLLRGASHVAIDSKGRMAIPARYRQQLQDCADGALVATVDPDYCLLIYPQPEWEKVELKLKDLPSMDSRARVLQRLYMGFATDMELDSQGRVLLTPPLREFAKLERRGVLIGQGNKFELWDEDLWKQKQEDWLAMLREDDMSRSQALESLSI